MACAVAWAVSGNAQAHDSWFEPRASTAAGEVVLALGTGNQFPVREYTIPLQQLQTTGCRGSAMPAAPMRWVADEPAALVLRTAQPAVGTAALTCWAQWRPLEVEIDDAIVDIYLKEIHALPAVRERWAALRAAGVRWKETYTKHARIELAGAGGEMPDARHSPSAAVPGLGMDIRLDTPLPLRAGEVLRAQLLRDGQPLAGQLVELRSDLSPFGIWRTTDADGRLQLPVPLAARWLLRAVDLQPAPDKAGAWVSRFVTLAFEVLPRR